jgi:hypothetical protein
MAADPAGKTQGCAPLRWAWRVAAAVARHPPLWPIAVRQALVLAAPGWWRHRPFLPLPAPDYLRFRLQTAYGGDGDRDPDPDDLVTYLRWCREQRSTQKWRRKGTRHQ